MDGSLLSDDASLARCQSTSSIFILGANKYSLFFFSLALTPLFSVLPFICLRIFVFVFVPEKKKEIKSHDSSCPRNRTVSPSSTGGTCVHH